MPITPAHAAAAPLLQRLTRPVGLELPLSALVIGSMTPDFEYLIRLSPGGGSWHSLPGLFEYCLPVGLVVWLLFREIIGPALIRLLPPGLGRSARAAVPPGPTIRLVPGAMLAVVLGAISHDIWDSFTHEARWGVREFPSLNTSVPLGAESPPIYAILQVASSVLGIALVIWIVWRWVVRQPRADRAIPMGDRAWRIREVSVLLLFGVVGAVLNASRAHRSGISITLGLAAVGSMSAFAVALLGYGIVGAIRHRPGTISPSRP